MQKQLEIKLIGIPPFQIILEKLCFKQIKFYDRRITIPVNKLCSGHCVPTHLYRLKIINSPKFNCGEVEDINHNILRYQRHRTPPISFLNFFTQTTPDNVFNIVCKPTYSVYKIIETFFF